MLHLLNRRAVVNVVRLSGVIAADGRNVLSLKNMKKLIDKAFASKQLEAVVLLINSPGGSPSQSEIIANYILYQSKDKNVPVISVVEDVAASGGYWVALAGSSIYALSSSSIVGSLGVVSASFGLDEFIAKHGISRRVYTAGEKKVVLDMFQPENAENVELFKGKMMEIYELFKIWVLKNRGEKIKISHDDLFSGEFWLACKGLEIGLVDEVINSLPEKLHSLFGKNIKINYLLGKSGFVSKLLLNSQSGSTVVDIADSFVEKLKSENLFSRYGL